MRNQRDFLHCCACLSKIAPSIFIPTFLFSSLFPFYSWAFCGLRAGKKAYTTYEGATRGGEKGERGRRTTDCRFGTLPRAPSAAPPRLQTCLLVSTNGPGQCRHPSPSSGAEVEERGRRSCCASCWMCTRLFTAFHCSLSQE